MRQPKKETPTRTLTLAVLLLSAYVFAGPPLPSTLFREPDGGWANRVNTSASSGGVSSSVSVTNFPVTQPVSGTLTCNVGTGTQPVSGTVAVSNQSADTTAIAVRCVNASGTSFESCAGTGGSGTSWEPDGGYIGLVSVTGYSLSGSLVQATFGDDDNKVLTPRTGLQVMTTPKTSQNSCTIDSITTSCTIPLYGGESSFSWYVTGATYDGDVILEWQPCSTENWSSVYWGVNWSSSVVTGTVFVSTSSSSRGNTAINAGACSLKLTGSGTTGTVSVIWRLSDIRPPEQVVVTHDSFPLKVVTGTTPLSVTGTFWQATQPVSLATVPAHTVWLNDWAGNKIDALAVDPAGSEWGLITRNIPSGTQAISASTLPLPAGAASSANQTTLGSQTTKINDGTDTALITATSGGSLQVECTAGCGSPATPVTYQYHTPAAVAGASKLFLDIFNATGSGKIVKILAINPVIKTDVAVVGALSIRFDLYRTSAVGTGGTAAAYKSATIDVAGGNIVPKDTANANLPATITARHLPAGGATISEWLDGPFFCFTEETNAGTYWCNGMHNAFNSGTTEQAITLREGQGLLIKQGTVASLNSIAFHVTFSTE